MWRVSDVFLNIWVYFLFFQSFLENKTQQQRSPSHEDRLVDTNARTALGYLCPLPAASARRASGAARPGARTLWGAGPALCWEAGSAAADSPPAAAGAASSTPRPETGPPRSPSGPPSRHPKLPGKSKRKPWWRCGPDSGSPWTWMSFRPQGRWAVRAHDAGTLGAAHKCYDLAGWNTSARGGLRATVTESGHLQRDLQWHPWAQPMALQQVLGPQLFPSASGSWAPSRKHSPTKKDVSQFLSIIIDVFSLSC